MKVPLDPLPDRQLCEYEKIREDIIEERRLAMEQCKDLKNTKKEIGFEVQKEKLRKKDKIKTTKSAKKLNLENEEQS